MESTIKKRLLTTIYIDKKRKSVEFGWVEKRFLLNKKWACFKAKAIDHLDRDIRLFPQDNIITASLEAILVWRERWCMPNYSFVARNVNVVQSYIKLKTFI